MMLASGGGLDVSPQAVTGLVVILGGLVAAYVVPLVLARRKDAGEQESTVFAAFSQLNTALQGEVTRLQNEQRSQREDYQRQLDAARTAMQGQLDSARARITELEAEVGALQRALRGGPVP